MYIKYMSNILIYIYISFLSFLSIRLSTPVDEVTFRKQIKSLISIKSLWFRRLLPGP